ncbi:hypothetical protein NQZ68_002195 [Dissostichus eleginoides]|nr:hypothetical protein NQZ68_002195 [Dissostichus eleginoides]
MTTEATGILLIKNMTLICVLIWTLLCCCFTESRGQFTVTQSGAVSSAPGRSVSITCRTNVKRPEVISGCPDLSEPLTRRQHNDDVTDSNAGHPGAPCSRFIRRNPPDSVSWISVCCSRTDSFYQMYSQYKC